MMRTSPLFFRFRQILAGWLIPIVVAATPLFGQATVPSGTSVRVTLGDRRVIEGQLIRSDSTNLTLAVHDSVIDIRRAQVSEMARHSLRTGTYARRVGAVGIVPGVVLGAVAFVVAASEGDGGSQSNGETVAAAAVVGLAGGVVGASVGAITGAVIGSFVHDWTPVSPSVSVTTLPRTGFYGVEACGREPMVNGTFGTRIDGGTSARLGLTLTCAGRVSGGAEVGTLGKKRDGTGEQFIGGFTEFRMGQQFLNPRLITSLGAYHESPPPAGNVVRWRPGAGFGAAVATPLWKHLSVGAETRVHFSGDGYTWITTALSGQYRP